MKSNINHSVTVNNILKLIKADLVKKNLFYTEGVKFGLDLLVYTAPCDKVHSKYGLKIYSDTLQYQDLVALQRVCTNSNKILILVKYYNNKLFYIEIKRFV